MKTKDMNLRDYEVKPDDGLFEKIQRRVAMRRALRISGMTLAALAVCGVAAALLWPKGATDEVAMLDPQASAVVEEYSATAVAETAEMHPAIVADVHNAQKVDVPTVVTKEPEKESVADEHAELAQLMPSSSMPTVKQLKEPAAVPMMNSTMSPVVPAVGGDTVRPKSIAEPESKASVPMPHYDNVIWAPNVIIPDGDVDENRTFVIKATSEITDFKLHIYNRSGRRIYLTTDPQFAWDGTMNGVRVPQGAYVWVATFRDSDGAPRQEKGTVTVLR